MGEALFAEYGDPQALSRAIGALRAVGYRKLDAYTPYGDENVRKALGLKRSRLPVAIFVAGVAGAAFTYFLQWFLVAFLYPVNVGGRPAHMPLPFMIITFEMGVLSAAFAAFFGLLYKARLLRLYDPIFEVTGIERTSVDKHWLRLDGNDEAYHYDVTRRDVEATSPLRLIRYRGREP